MISPIEVTNWLTNQDRNTVLSESISWVLEHWLELHNANEPKLISEMLVDIKKSIGKISTGKRRAYRRALEVIVEYLSEHLRWSIPLAEKRKIQDASNLRYQLISAESANAQKLLNGYESLLEEKAKTAFVFQVEFLAISLLLDTAPIPLPSIFYLLSHPATVEEINGVATISYPINLGEIGQSSHSARYKLGALSYRLLTNYFKSNKSISNVNVLRKKIKKLLASEPFYIEISSDSQLNRIVACHWQKILPQFFLDDFMNPTHQFALSPERYKSLVQCKTTMKFPNQKTLFDSYISLNINVSGKVRFPHKNLLKRYKKIGKKALLAEVKKAGPITWQEHNILPQLYYLYVVELITYGGAKKDNLAISSIETYTNGENYLTKYPLSLEQAMNEEPLNSWAKSFYQNVDSESVRQHLLYFLRFMAEQEITDSLNVGAFKSIYLPKITDANLVSATELREIMLMLFKGDAESKMQKLFTLVVISLSFHASLRRGEILRLRIRDIEPCEHKGALFRVIVTNTVEGKTKNRKTRVVHVNLPIEEAQLLRCVLKIKQSENCNSPLIGFSGELVSSRERQYILPITRAIKMICGSKCRFHHLRHGGVFVLTNQALLLFTEIGKKHNCPYLNRLLHPEFIKKRFSYWLENRSIKLINSAVAFDEVAGMIGHSLFDTTRSSYLHGHEWLIDYFKPQAICYSKKQLRFLFDLPAHSNDISRRVKILLDKDISNSQTLFHSSATLLTNRVAEMTVRGGSGLSWLHKNPPIIDSFNWVRGWLNELDKSTKTFDVITRHSIKKSITQSLITWSELSKIKLLVYRNTPRIDYDKPTQKLIKNFLSNLDIESSSFEMFLTNKSLIHYKKLFGLPEFSIFQRQIILFKNEHTASNHKREFIEKNLLFGRSKLVVESISSGKSRVEVSLALKNFPIKKLLNIYCTIYL